MMRNMLVFIVMLLSLVIGMTVSAQDDTETRVREYTLEMFTAPNGDPFQRNVTPLDIGGDINTTASKTHVEVFAFTGSENAGTTTGFNVRWLIDGDALNIASSCTTAITDVNIGAGGIEGGAGGAGESRLTCTMDYRSDPFIIESIVNEDDNTHQPRHGFTVTQTEIYNHTAVETELPPAIESGAFVRDVREYHEFVNKTNQTAPVNSFTLERNVPVKNLDSVLLRNESETRLIVHYAVTASSLTDDITATLDINVDQSPVTNPCILIISGDVTGTTTGGTFLCRLTDYHNGFTTVNVTVTDPDNVITALSMSTELRQTEIRLVPLMPQQIGIAELDFWIPVLFWLIVMLSAWRKMWILTGFVALAGFLIEFLPEDALAWGRVGALLLLVASIAIEFFAEKFRIRREEEGGIV